MSGYKVKDWHDKVPIRRGFRLDVPGATEIFDGYGTYYVYCSSQDPEYQKLIQAKVEHSADRDELVRAKLRARKAARLFEEMWLRRMAGEALEDIEASEAA